VVHRCVHKESGKMFAVKIVNISYLRKKGIILFIYCANVACHVSHLSVVMTKFML